MKIGILEAGAPPSALAGRFGSYSNMFRRLLGPAFKFDIFDVRGGMIPTTEDDCEGYLVTGSSAGVYDSHSWIRDLENFIRQRAGSAPMVGVCFGHQLMAQALGGTVIKSPKGWGLGLQQYALTGAGPWMGGPDPIHLPVSHQDQVTAIGPDARVLAGNAFTPFGVIDYPALKAFSIQAHPEFEPEFAAAMVDHRRGAQLDDATADAAIASLNASNDSQRVAVWLRRFFTQH